ncbi:hypothetical protein EII36_02300 [Staphylococcus epidermidis]|uniref:hypothetical protein n=1 Tax=Staphylococcus TaxID=1279 RepID=UPI000F5C544C|nr:MULTISPECIES: hypothetical protein [Staphylococcus]KAB2174666.1 hypothetical protein F9B30_08130 [Staphylococcus epidermidis]MBC2973687.1 hypothetical protein [Staphylococcus epidermidis]MBC2975475.1 hypothetical protein [Staphylococcus epidermidis]MBC3012380.1 hypothetical protein [Staphylococcus epidermidis]MBE7351161.1 hypothetical protein [Staphylococcus epidermidis]
MGTTIEIFQEQVSDYELFTRFNTCYIQERIALMEMDIENMYDRTTPSLCSDTVLESIYYESYSVENLAIAILEERQKLERYKRKSQRDLNAFYTVLGRFSTKEQKYIKNYINTHSEAHMNVIERFKIELYKYIQTNRNERNKGIENNYSYINDKHQKLKTYPHKLTLNQEKALKEKEDGATEKNMNNDEFVAKLNDLDKKSFKKFIYNRNENNIDFEKVLILLQTIPKRLTDREIKKPYNYIREIGLKTN